VKIKEKDISLQEIPSKNLSKLKSLIYDKRKNRVSSNCLRKLYKERTKNDGKISVAFVVQMPEIWEKLLPVFELMINDERFSVCQIIVPSYDFKSGHLHEFGYEKEYFERKYPQVKKILFKENMNLFSEYKFDYVFIQRPYNLYLPDELKSSNIVRYSRICYIPYGKETFKDSVQYNNDFFRDVYITFLAGIEEFSFFENRYNYNRSKGYQKIVWRGYPCFERCYRKKKTPEEMHILWTPRWSYDSYAGGSHFIEYKDIIIKIKKRYPDIKLTIRPHPLMWDNFIKEKIMTPNEVEQFKSEAVQAGISFDNEKLFEDSIKNKSILVTDISSIIPEYFLSERPIIYCPADLTLNSFYNDILDGTYIARSENDILQIIDDLISGHDPMLDKRKKIINEKFDYLEDASRNILEYILEDYRSRIV